MTSPGCAVLGGGGPMSAAAYGGGCMGACEERANKWHTLSGMHRQATITHKLSGLTYICYLRETAKVPSNHSIHADTVRPRLIIFTTPNWVSSTSCGDTHCLPPAITQEPEMRQLVALPHTVAGVSLVSLKRRRRSAVASSLPPLTSPCSDLLWAPCCCP